MQHENVGHEQRAEALGAVQPDPIAGMIARGEHRDALVACIRSHGASVGRLCMALLGNQSDTDEATQETLLAAHASLGGFRAEGTVRAWLFGIARRVCARRLESRAIADRRLRLVEAGRDTTPLGVDELLARRRDAESVRHALETLKPTEREALVLRYLAELTYAEVAQACGIDEAAARKRVSRGLNSLRESLTRG